MGKYFRKTLTLLSLLAALSYGRVETITITPAPNTHEEEYDFRCELQQIIGE